MTSKQQRSERAYAKAVSAERDRWVRHSGTAGWQKELNRRRAEHIGASRERRYQAALSLVVSELGGQLIRVETTDGDDAP